MSVSFSCPNCGVVLQRSHEDDSPCPECGATLADAGGGLTGPATKVGTATAPLPSVPDLSKHGLEYCGRLGHGGMGVVSKYWQPELSRFVAVKALPASLARDPDRLSRFRTEARVAAGLVQSQILTIHAILEAHGNHYLVMPFIDGPDLGRVIAERRRAAKAAPGADREYLERIMPLLDHLVDAVAVLHRADVLHCDIKPSNLLVAKDGHLWLADFGLARFGVDAEPGQPSAGLGTRGYASPEQSRGDADLDGRADVFSVGATIYEALTLALPYGREPLTEDAPPATPPSQRQPLLPRDFDAVILKALQPDRQRRHASAGELQAEWRRLRQPTDRWPRALVAVLILLLLVCGVLASVLLSDDTVYRLVHIATEPPGGRIHMIGVNDVGDPIPDRAYVIEPNQTAPRRLPAGTYRVEAKIPGRGHHHVYRTVPDYQQNPTAYAHEQWERNKNGTLQLPPIKIRPMGEVTQEMCYFPGGGFAIGDERLGRARRPQLRDVLPFHLDTTEVTVEAYRKVKKSLPAALLEAMPDPPPNDFDQHAVTFVNFFQALDYAERVGKRLMTIEEYEFAIMNGGSRTDLWWTDRAVVDGHSFKPGVVREPKFDQTPTKPPVFGLFSGVAEWVDSRIYPHDPEWHPSQKQYDAINLRFMRDGRAVRGAPFFVTKLPFRKNPSELSRGPKNHVGEAMHQSLPNLGFRCAFSASTSHE